jgi:UPF0755 protein
MGIATVARRSFHLVFNAITIPAVLILAGVWFWKYEFMAYLNRPLAPDKAPFYYNFSYGSTANTLISDLHQKGLIKKPKYLRLYLRFFANADNLKAGVYKIDPASLTPARLFEQVKQGLVAKIKVRLRAGSTTKAMLKRLKTHRHVRQNADALNTLKTRIANLPDNPEGMFFPDTYLVQPGIELASLLSAAYDAMQDHLKRAWAQRDPNIRLKTPYEALILASIIEKETADRDEKPIISAVFHNRMKKRMRLQTDPTIIYGLGDQYTGNLTRTHLRTDNPYNTYTRRGLPSTPICNPSLSSLHAALHPSDSDMLFFVAKGDGTHQFSKTYADHKKAVYQYQILPFKNKKKSKASVTATP